MVKCKKCQQEVSWWDRDIGTGLCKPCRSAKTQPEPAKSEYKKCPFCAETIRLEATFCRFCQKELPAGEPIAAEAPKAMEGQAVAPVAQQQSGNTFAQVGGGVLLSLIGIWFLFLGSNLFNGSEKKLPSSGKYPHLAKAQQEVQRMREAGNEAAMKALEEQQAELDDRLANPEKWKKIDEERRQREEAARQALNDKRRRLYELEKEYVTRLGRKYPYNDNPYEYTVESQVNENLTILQWKLANFDRMKQREEVRMKADDARSKWGYGAPEYKQWGKWFDELYADEKAMALAGKKPGPLTFPNLHVKDGKQ